MKENFQKLREADFELRHFLTIQLILIVVMSHLGGVFIASYGIFSFIFSGAGSNSFLQDLFFCLGFYFIPLSGILYKAGRYMFSKNKDFRKAKNYCFTLFSYSIVYVVFLLILHTYIH
jgi:hypothetical protein